MSATPRVEVAASQIRAVFRQMIQNYEVQATAAQAEMIGNLRREPDLPEPDAGHEWVAEYTVEQNIVGPVFGPFKEQINVKTSWEQVPVGNS